MEAVIIDENRRVADSWPTARVPSASAIESASAASCALQFPRSAGGTYYKKFDFRSERFLAQADLKNGACVHEQAPGSREGGANLRLPRRPDRLRNGGPPSRENTVGEGRQFSAPHSYLQSKNRKEETRLGAEQVSERCGLDRRC